MFVTHFQIECLFLQEKYTIKVELGLHIKICRLEKVSALALLALKSVTSFRIAPNQHRPLAACQEEPGTASLPRSLVRSSTSTPKLRAESSRPFAPAKKTSTASAVLVFFVMVVGETEARGA